MKKYLALLLGALFILGFAASAFAIHAEIPSETQAVVAKGQTQITLGGEIRVRGEYRDNVSDFDDDRGDNNAAYDQRVRLSIEGKVTPNTVGFVHVESGGADNADNVVWGRYGANGATGIYNVSNSKHDDLRILEAWIQHSGSGLLGFPAFVKVGHMPLALGNRLFFDHTKFGDDAIVLAADPLKELHVAVLTIKFREGSNILNDDSNAYVGLFAYNTKEFGLSGDVTYIDDQTFSPEGLHFWNFGLRGNIMLAGLNIRADGEFQTGEADGTPTDFKGWAVVAGVDLKLDPVKLTAEFAYGSGGDSGDGVNDTDGDVGAFVTSLGADIHYTYVYEYRTPNACGNIDGGLCNTIYAKLGASADLAKDLSGWVNGYWLQAAEENAAGDDDIGIEVDAKIAYKIDRNLTYYVEGGYLFADDFMRKDADDAWAVRHGIQLVF